MQTIKIDLSESLRQVELHTFADLHLGDCYTDHELIKQRLREVAEKDNAYIILNGDLLNNATKTSVSDSYAEDIPPMQQIQTAVEMLQS